MATEILLAFDQNRGFIVAAIALIAVTLILGKMIIKNNLEQKSIDNA